MRRAAAILILSIAAAIAVGRIDAAPLPPPTVPCDIAVARKIVSPENDRVVFGRVAFPATKVFQIAKTTGPLPHWSKVPLFVRAGRTRVTIVVPLAWRSRAAVNWSSGWTPRLHVAGCPSPPNVWNVYTGGFVVREPACVPLVVRVGERNATVRLGIGKACQ